jgi:PAS domain S-box-containing protein
LEGRTSWDEHLSHAHSVQFYENDDFLLDGLSRFMGAALLAGDATVIVATKPHRDGLSARLSARGLDLQPAILNGRYLCLDAAETLLEFMVDGLPDPPRFSRVIGSVLTRLRAAAKAERPRIAAFGEMVALLWAEGKRDAAIQLEQLWNELAETHSFQLHCAYPIHLFSQAEDSAFLERICAEHSHAVPAEGYTTLSSDAERSRKIVLLQQKAHALEVEILGRKQAEQLRCESEDRLRLAEHVAGIGTFEFNVTTQVYRCSPEWEAMYGLAPGEFAGTREAWEQLLHPDDRVEAMKLVEIGYASGAPMEGEWRVVWPDGSIHWIAGKWQVFKSESGIAVKVSGANIDITDRKRTEETALQLASIVQSSCDAIVSKDLDGIVTSWNRAAETIFGYRAEEILGRSILLIIPPELHDQEPRLLEMIRVGERIEHFETVRLRKNGERLNVSLTISPIKNHAGSIVGVAKIVRNITRQKLLEESLRISEKLAAVGRLAATIAHEINNPLEAVTNLIYLSRQQSGLPEQLKNYLKCADRELQRVSHIARQTLGFYRDNSQPVEFRVASAIGDVLAVYDSRLKHKTLRIEKKIRRGLRVCTAQGEFKQVLSNLIANAIDASNKGGRILIRARAARHFQSGHKGIRVTIADDGLGVSPDNRQRLFTPFFTTKREVGTGLGLWITKDLIEKKGGSIQFRSQNQGKSGTAIRFFLPMQLPVESSGPGLRLELYKPGRKKAVRRLA